MGQKWSKQQDDYYLGNGGSPYSINNLTGILSHDRRTDVMYSDIPPESGEPHTVIIGSRSALPLLDIKSKKKNKQPDLLRRLGIVVRTQGSRLTKSATVVVSDLLRVDGTKIVARNKTWGTDPRNWQGKKGPAEASGAIRIGDTIHAINGARVANKTRSQLMKILTENLSNQHLVITFRHGDTMPQVPWEMEYCIDPPEGNYFESENEWGFLTPMKIGSVSI